MCWYETCDIAPAVEERSGVAYVRFTGRLWSFKEDLMRRTSLAVVVAIAAIMVFSLLLVPLVGATSAAAPALQTTGTAVGTEVATTTGAATAAATTTGVTEVATTTGAATAAATTTGATAAATASTTSAATPTRAPSALPNTGGDSGMSALLLGAAALVLIGVATALLMGRRRD